MNAFVASLESENEFDFFLEKLLALNLFVITDKAYLTIEIRAIYDKLMFQYERDDDFISSAVAKSSLPYIEENKGNAEVLFILFQNGKKKRNVGDKFKHIVSDNWKADMVVTFNIRSNRNNFDLRDSRVAWFQIQWLAQAMKEITPKNILNL